LEYFLLKITANPKDARDLMKTIEKGEAVWRGEIPAWPKPIDELRKPLSYKKGF
jgi:hypothetical protein